MATDVATPVNQSVTKSIPQRVVDAVVASGAFSDMLPQKYRQFADRYLARAKLYISRKPELQQCTVGSLVQCVLSAAEHGLCLDGRMAHAVKFNTKKKDANGKEAWSAEATYMPSYFGIIDVCRRHGAIIDAFAEHVYANDEFSYYMDNGRYHHRWQQAMGDRGKWLGAFTVLLLPGDRFRVIYMSESEINHVRNKSKSKDNGPWVTDTGEMQKKTVLKRALKTYITDPDTADMLERDDFASGCVDNGVTSIAATPATKSLDDHEARSRPALTNSRTEALDLPATEDRDYVLDETPTITEQADTAAVAAAQAKLDEAREVAATKPAASVYDVAKYLSRIENATMKLDVDRILAEAQQPDMPDDDLNQITEAAVQRKEAIRDSRGK